MINEWYSTWRRQENSCNQLPVLSNAPRTIGQNDAMIYVWVTSQYCYRLMCRKRQCRWEGVFIVCCVLYTKSECVRNKITAVVHTHFSHPWEIRQSVTRENHLQIAPLLKKYIHDKPFSILYVSHWYTVDFLFVFVFCFFFSGFINLVLNFILNFQRCSSLCSKICKETFPIQLRRKCSDEFTKKWTK